MINVEWRDPLKYNGNNYISHYGRKGMKWYQHIFGKEEKDQKSLLETVSSDTNKTIANMSDGVKIYLNYKKTNSKGESPNQPKISITDEELSRAIRRIEMEKKYRSLTEPKKKDGYDRAMAALGIIGSITASAASAAAIVTAIYNFKK